MEDELGGQTMKEFFALRIKTYSYLTDINDEDKKKAKNTKKCVMKRKHKFADYKHCLKAAKFEYEIKH